MIGGIKWIKGGYFDQRKCRNGNEVVRESKRNRPIEGNL